MQTVCSYIHVHVHYNIHVCVSGFLYLLYACKNTSCCSSEEAAFELFFTENLVHELHNIIRRAVSFMYIYIVYTTVRISTVKPLSIGHLGPARLVLNCP